MNNVETATTNVIYFITCGYLKNLNFGDKGRRLGERFGEHHRDAKYKKNNISQIGFSFAHFIPVFFVSKGCFLYMSSNDNSCANKQTNVHFKSYFVFPQFKQ